MEPAQPQRVVISLALRRSDGTRQHAVFFPQVMQTMRPIPASAASMMAADAPDGGTEMNEASAPVASTASFTEAKTGSPSISSPPRLGLVPATTLVP